MCNFANIHNVYIYACICKIEAWIENPSPQQAESFTT